jgi:hypothetical protein
MNTLTENSKAQVQYINEVLRFMYELPAMHEFMSLNIDTIDIGVLERTIVPMFGMNILIQRESISELEVQMMSANRPIIKPKNREIEITIRKGEMGRDDILVINPTDVVIGSSHQLYWTLTEDQQHVVDRYTSNKNHMNVLVLNIQEILL